MGRFVRWLSWRLGINRAKRGWRYLMLLRFIRDEWPTHPMNPDRKDEATFWPPDDKPCGWDH